MVWSKAQDVVAFPSNEYNRFPSLLHGLVEILFPFPSLLISLPSTKSDWFKEIWCFAFGPRRSLDKYIDVVKQTLLSRQLVSVVARQEPSQTCHKEFIVQCLSHAICTASQEASTNMNFTVNWVLFIQALCAHIQIYLPKIGRAHV